MPVGSHGDVHPFIGVGLALRARGHRVRAFTSGYYAALFVDRTTESYLAYRTDDVYFYVALGLLLSLLPATPLYPRLLAFYRGLGRRREWTTLAAILLFVFSVGQIAVRSFSPFLYFRF